MSNYCTFYKLIEEDDEINLSFKANSCYGDVFKDSVDYDEIILAIPVNLDLLSDRNYGSNTSMVMMSSF